VSSPLSRRLGLIAALGVAVFFVVFAVPALTPKGSKEAFPAWRSVDGVPVLDELPGAFVGVLRIARERTSEDARTSIVLGPGPDVACEPVSVKVADAKPYVVTPDSAQVENDCKGLRLITLKTLPGKIVIELGGDTWTLDPSARDPRSCQLGRDRTCAYWLFKGGRFGDPIAPEEPRVQSGTVQTVLAVGDALSAGDTDAANRTVEFGDPQALLLCAAGAAPQCANGLAAKTPND
jgi:hypothetical protein